MLALAFLTVQRAHHPDPEPEPAAEPTGQPTGQPTGPAPADEGKAQETAGRSAFH